MQVSGGQVTALLRFNNEGLKQIGVEFLDYEWVVTVKDGKIQGYPATVTEESMKKLIAALASAQVE